MIEIRKLEKMMWWRLVRVLFDLALSFLLIQSAFDSRLDMPWRFVAGGLGAFTLIDSIRAIKMLVVVRGILKKLKLNFAVEEWREKQRKGTRLH